MEKKEQKKLKNVKKEKKILSMKNLIVFFENLLNVKNQDQSILMKKSRIKLIDCIIICENMDLIAQQRYFLISIGKGYSANLEFKNNIDKFGEGFAEYISEAKEYYVNRHK